MFDENEEIQKKIEDNFDLWIDDDIDEVDL